MDTTHVIVAKSGVDFQTLMAWAATRVDLTIIKTLNTIRTLLVTVNDESILKEVELFAVWERNNQKFL